MSTKYVKYVDSDQQLLPGAIYIFTYIHTYIHTYIFENLYSPRIVVYNKKTKINTMTKCESELN